jgi:hypothetical protein
MDSAQGLLALSPVGRVRNMHERYDYYNLTIERGAGPQLRSAFYADAARTASYESDAPYALFYGMIGLHLDELIAMTTTAGSDASAAATLPGVQDASVMKLVATVRPVDTTPPVEDAVYAHRWFRIERGDWDEFVALSVDGIWPYLESEDCRIVGLWEALEDDPLMKLLLITRYPSVAYWERTRMQSPDPPPGADAGLYARAHEAGRKRAPLTQQTIVRLCRLIPPP